jgi:plastocyanin
MVSVFLVVTVISLAFLAACTTGNSSTTQKTASGNLVTVVNFAFSPQTLSVTAGTTVTWTNRDSTTHTITSDTGVFNSGNLATNSSFTYTFSNTGSYAYHCAIHPSMTGTIIVR